MKETQSMIYATLAVLHLHANQYANCYFDSHCGQLHNRNSFKPENKYYTLLMAVRCIMKTTLRSNAFKPQWQNI